MAANMEEQAVLIQSTSGLTYLLRENKYRDMFLSRGNSFVNYSTFKCLMY